MLFFLLRLRNASSILKDMTLLYGVLIITNARCSDDFNSSDDRYLLISCNSKTNIFTTSTDVTGRNIAQKQPCEQDEQELKKVVGQMNSLKLGPIILLKRKMKI